MTTKQFAAHEKKNMKKKGGSSAVVRSTRNRKPVGDAKINVYLGFSDSEDEDETAGDSDTGDTTGTVPKDTSDFPVLG